MKIDFQPYRSTLKEIEAEFKTKVIYIIFNDKKEIERYFNHPIKKFLSELRDNRAILILEGIGGDSIAGRLLALDLIYQFNKGYFVAIPNFAQSALVFSLFPSLVLLMDNNGYISPTEPLIKRCSSKNQRFESCVTIMKDGNEKEKRNSARIWAEQGNFILSLFKLGKSSIIHNSKDLNLKQMEEICKLFLGSPHDKRITKQDLKKVGFYCFDVDGKAYWMKIKDFTNCIKRELGKDKTINFIIGDSDSEKVI